MGIQLLIKLKAKVHPVKSIFDGLPSAAFNRVKVEEVELVAMVE